MYRPPRGAADLATQAECLVSSAQKEDCSYRAISFLRRRRQEHDAFRRRTASSQLGATRPRGSSLR